MTTKLYIMNNNYNQTISNNSIRVLATLEAKEGKLKELLNILLPIVEASRKEDGNISYILNSSLERPNELLFDEVWSSKEDFDKHYNQKESKDNRNKITDLVLKPLEIKLFKEI